MTTLPHPPGPPGRPLLGHAAEFRRDPLALMAAVARDYGPVAQIRLGPQRMVLVSRSEEIERVLVTDASRYRKSRILTVVGRPVLGDALDALDGDRWARRRRIAAPAFHARSADAEARAVGAATEAMCAQWSDGETRAFDRDALATMTAAACQSIAGYALGAANADAVGAAMKRALAGFGGRVRLGLPLPSWLPIRHNRDMRAGMRVVHRVTHETIAAARARGSAEAGRRAMDDDTPLATVLRACNADGGPALTESELVDEIAVMFALGGHQMALALSWAVHLLAEHPDVAARLHAELDTAAANETARDIAADLPFTGMVIDETLRLFPPFFLVVREAAVDAELGGFRIDRGTTIGLSTWATHRSPAYFDEPDAFRPERWADGLARRLPRFAYFPYGGGARVCIARAFVHRQLVLALATIARRFTMAPAPGHRVVPRPETALSMRDGLRIIVRRRERATVDGRARLSPVPSSARRTSVCAAS